MVGDKIKKLRGEKGERPQSQFFRDLQKFLDKGK
jgi:hypothetical protein